MSKRAITYFPSKILLFGEYTVTVGGDAIAIPFEKFSGSWQFDKSKDNSFFYDFIAYLNKINWNELKTVFLYDKFVEDLNNGLHFDSNIKIGFGLGSSGALCAGLYDRYFVTKNYDIFNLNKILAKIESFFHGVSSGIDPMVSYLNKAVVTNSTGFNECDQSVSKMKNYNFYLLDTNIARSTKKYVNIFNEKIKNDTYKKEILKPLLKYNNKIVFDYTNGNEAIVFDLFKRISELQYQGLFEMIIPELSPIWKNILSLNDIAIKLCGAGGGGYYLLMAKKGFDISGLLNHYYTVKV